MGDDLVMEVIERDYHVCCAVKIDDDQVILTSLNKIK
jgi:hypothetical protein